MKQRNAHIQEELKEISPAVANLPVKMPFDLPEFYFERFPDQVMARIREDLSVSEELEQLSPLLAGLKKQSPFAVPEGYFERLEPGSMGKEALVLPIHRQGTDLNHVPPVSDQQPGSIVGMGRWKTGLRWAAAAAIAGLLFGTIYLSGRQDEPANTDSAAMAQLGATQQADSLPLSEETLAGFLNGTEDLPDENLTLFETLPGENLVSVDFSDKKFEEILGQIPDNELEAFFSESPEPTSMNSLN